ncbi:hypothetical protein EOE65_16535 [Neptunomonas marina]|uniref:Large ribosomal RNA subunit accumulation protein YceD n=2 Tax=Neptunomonas marina TaxID=1815562 RepID=A0A437Q4D1_9GAMM|nr:hypothetical protein EOE65_16535 [Neptunomonas marina]
MSYGNLPKIIDPRKLAEREVRIAGQVKAEKMPRLASYLCQGEDEISVDLLFSLDELRIRTITGSAEGHVHMTCQRCLDPVEVDVKAEFNLAIAFNEERAKQLPRYYDPLIVEEEDIELLPIVEEELILSLPLVPYHADCSVQTSFGDAEAIDEPEPEKTNPFSVLAQLKADKK